MPTTCIAHTPYMHVTTYLQHPPTFHISNGREVVLWIPSERRGHQGLAKLHDHGDSWKAVVPSADSPLNLPSPPQREGHHVKTPLKLPRGLTDSDFHTSQM